MKSKSHSAESEETGIDLAPMLDFVLNLLIFFIITTSFVKEAGITVSKPEALTAENKENGNILIAIRPNGDIWMDKRQVDITEIRGAIDDSMWGAARDSGTFLRTHENKAIATLKGNRGTTMLCRFELDASEAGMRGGGTGTCQTSKGAKISATF